MELKVTQSAHLRDPFGDGRNYLELTVNRERVLISSEQIKLSLLRRNCVFMGHEWEGVLPEIKLPADPATGARPITLQGFTDDPAIVRLVREWLVFEHGPLPELA